MHVARRSLATDTGTEPQPRSTAQRPNSRANSSDISTLRNKKSINTRRWRAARHANTLSRTSWTALLETALPLHGHRSQARGHLKDEQKRKNREGGFVSWLG
jgi:hypothetical protein